MRYNSIDHIPDSLMSKEDQYGLKIGINWFLKLLDLGIPLDDEAFTFCLRALNDRAEALVRQVKRLIVIIGSDVLPRDESPGFIRVFNEEDACSSMTSANLEELVKKGKARLARPIVLAMKSELKSRLKELNTHGSSTTEKARYTLKKYFHLNRVELDLLTALYLLDNCSPVEDYFDSHLSCKEPNKARLLAKILGIQGKTLRRALTGKLAKLELIDRRMSLSIEDIAKSIFETPGNDVEDLFYKRLNKEILPMDYYMLDEGVADHIVSLFKTAGATPTHILLYGEPGTGKSSFASTLAKTLGVVAYGVSSPNDDNSSSRKTSLEACLNMTENGRDGLVVIDEADELLNAHLSILHAGERQGKGWLNELLERPELRTLWITNTIDGIPASVMRRFAYSVSFTKLGKAQRCHLWEQVLTKNKAKSLIAPNDILRLATEYSLSAGSIDLAVKKAKEIAGRKKALFKQAVQYSLTASQQLLNGGSLRQKDHAIEREYSLEGLNLDTDIASLNTQLQAFNSYLKNEKQDLRVNMNLLFYGPPGTGKTEMSRYISQHLERELMVRRMSDLLGMYVGQSEQQIAEAFRQAEKEQAVLVIDEADSLLYSREKAVRSWETSMVNEFLTQMEHFRGLLICTTNRLEELDPASLRRFNHKIRFDFLTSEGNSIFYDRMLAPLSNKQPTADVMRILQGLINLTPGDFKIIRDRFAFYPKHKVHPRELVQGLARESEIKTKNGRVRTIGFAGTA